MRIYKEINLMKKVLLVLGVLATFTSTCLRAADEDMSVPVAEQEYLLEVLESCQSLAAEDEVDTDTLNDYLLVCINDDLEAMGYQLIKSLPKS